MEDMGLGVLRSVEDRAGVLHVAAVCLARFYKVSTMWFMLV